MSIDGQLLKTTRKIVVALIEKGNVKEDNVSVVFDKIYKSLAETTGESLEDK